MNAAETNPLIRWTGPIGTVLVTLAVIVWAASRGEDNAASALTAVAVIAIAAGLVASLVLFSAWGLGRLAKPLQGSEATTWSQAGLGICLLLWITHLLGMLGAYADPTARIVAYAITGAGLAIFAVQIARGPLRPEGWPVMPPSFILGAFPLGVLIVAACSAPGWLWDSEIGGYDVLSYHLQLPKEWALNGRLWPLEHNVYSYLPGYVEALSLHVFAILGGTRGVFDREGLGIISTQFVQVGFAVIAALLIGRCTWLITGRLQGETRDDDTDRIRVLVSVITGALVLATPWVAVVGSMSYNELGVVVAGAAAVLCILESKPLTVKYALCVGFAAGIACSAKPTALFLAVPFIGLVMVSEVPTNRLAKPLIGATLGGLIALAPWLIRNAMAGGNPVFPFLTDIFGLAHWTPEQVSRYAEAHSVTGGLTERLRIATTDRGPLHVQWALTFPVGIIGLCIGAASRPFRRLAILSIVALVVQLLAWLLLTHIQSRFLLPMILPLAIGTGVGLAVVMRATMIGRPGSVKWLAAGVCCLLPLASAGATMTIFAKQGNGRPNTLLTGNVGAMTGQILAEQLEMEPQETRLLEAIDRAFMPMTIVNAGLETDALVYLLGDATPLYYMRPVIYHTTWDASPLGDAIRVSPDDPIAWTRALRDRGITHVVINQSEVHRLVERDGWYDPDVTVENLARWTPVAGRAIPWPMGEQRGFFIVKLFDPDAIPEGQTP